MVLIQSDWKREGERERKKRERERERKLAVSPNSGGLLLTFSLSICLSVCGY
jgi:hypothetical protein